MAAKKINFKDLYCQEITGQAGGFEVKCGHKAKKIIFRQKDPKGQHVYLMCSACAQHLLKNRDNLSLIPDDKIASELQGEIKRAKDLLTKYGAVSHPKLTVMIHKLLTKLGIPKILHNRIGGAVNGKDTNEVKPQRI